MMLRKNVEKLISGTISGYNRLVALNGRWYRTSFSGDVSDTNLAVDTKVVIKGELDSSMNAYLDYELKADFSNLPQIEEKAEVAKPEDVDKALEKFEDRLEMLVQRIESRANLILQVAKDYTDDIKKALEGMQEAYKEKDEEKMLKHLNYVSIIANWKTSVDLGKLYDTFKVMRNAAGHFAPSIDDFAKIHSDLKAVERPVIRYFRQKGVFVPQGVYDKGIDHDVVVKAVMADLLKV